MSAPSFPQNAPPKSRILWTGNLLDARCNLAIDSTFNAAAPAQHVYFVMTSFDVTLDGTVQITITSPEWMNGLIDAVCQLYLNALMNARVDNNVTLH